MKNALLLMLTGCACAFAQETPRTDVVYQSAGAGMVTAAVGRGMNTPVQGAPYSATISNESVQTLADGNHIIQNTTGTTARDSQGRTRQDAALPAIGNLSAANAPHLVFILDPVTQTSYTLNLTDKTAQKMSMPSGGVQGPGPALPGGPDGSKIFFVQTPVGAGGPMPPPPPPGVMMYKSLAREDDSQITTEDLGSQNMEGLLVNGIRTTRVIAAGQIGNENPIRIVTEVWTSPDLKTVVYSKRSDPRIGEQTFKLTNIVRGEPNASLFTVPADFKVMDGPQGFVYRPNL